MTTPINITLDKTYDGNPMVYCTLSTKITSSPSFMTQFTQISDSLNSNLTNTISCKVKPDASSDLYPVQCSSPLSYSQNNLTIGLGTYTEKIAWGGINLSKYDSCTLTPTIISSVPLIPNVPLSNVEINSSIPPGTTITGQTILMTNNNK